MTESSSPATSLGKREAVSESDDYDNMEVDARAGHIKPAAQDGFSEQAPSRILVDSDAGKDAAPTEPEVALTHEVRHEVAFPLDYAEEHTPLHQHVPWSTPAREYPFTLDPFQRLAINCVERNESVLVSAHTSAGKTVVAEYAIATALKAKQRVIYTSPIKALSNQKYRELQERFTDVGLMTGDVTLSPDASCLVMTTEILRSMLYRGSEVMREVAWVVFDEIHYMRDRERGVVWEETLILLPHSVRFVFLSATIPNARQFARWICHLHGQPCHVVYTNFRPTPLQHYLFPSGADGIYLVVDEKSVFREDNFRKALNVVAASETAQGNKGPGPVIGREQAQQRKKPIRQGPESGLYKIVKMIIAKAYQPVIVFSFSKRDCETYAMQMAKLDFNSDDEKRLVQEVFKNALESLNEEDRSLPQIESILPLLKRGIGIHHSGLLPILKEVIEILFQEGLIKVLFATETFSIGLNMPAKTVVFTSVRKFDGSEFRWISSGEYIQMSGRAGRRGLDTRGIVIMMVEEQMDPSVAKAMIKGQPDALNSAFHLSYNMILNLMRVEGTSPDTMLERSFFQFQSGDSIPELELKLKTLRDELDTIGIENEPEVTRYAETLQQAEKLRADWRKIVHHPSYSLPFLQSGRLVRVKTPAGIDYGWGVVVNVRASGSSNGRRGGNAQQRQQEYTVDALLSVIPDTAIGTVPQPAIEGQPSELMLLPCTIESLDGISSLRTHLPADLTRADQRLLVSKSLQVIRSRFPMGVPLLDPIKDMRITDKAFADLLRKMDVLDKTITTLPIHSHDNLGQLMELWRLREEKRMKLETFQREITTANQIVQQDELRCRKRVLKRLGYCTDEDVIELKGRVACEVSTGDELLLTELIFAGGFNDLSIEQTVSLLSCFVFEEKADEPPKLREELVGPLRLLQEAARRVCKVSVEAGLQLDEQKYLETFRPELMEVVWAWVRGAKFAKICQMTDVFEGSIIRCMRRLEELLRQLALAAKSIGSDVLEAKFTAGIALLKRDIVFANSLYL